MSAVAPSEDLAMVPLGKDSPPAAQLAQSHTQELNLDDAEATLPWDQVQHDAAGEMPGVLETNTRPSPEGSMKAAALGSATDHQTFLKSLDDDECSGVPDVAAHTFVPIDPLCIERRPRSHKKQPWQLAVPPQDRAPCQEEKCDPEQQTFLARGYSASLHDLPDPAGEPPQSLCCWTKGCCNSANLKAVASMSTALIVFPGLIYGAYVFLPFDVPVMESTSARLAYTLRCGVFATFPIILAHKSPEDRRSNAWKLTKERSNLKLRRNFLRTIKMSAFQVNTPIANRTPRQAGSPEHKDISYWHKLVKTDSKHSCGFHLIKNKSFPNGHMVQLRCFPGDWEFHSYLPPPAGMSLILRGNYFALATSNFPLPFPHHHRGNSAASQMASVRTSFRVNITSATTQKLWVLHNRMFL